MPSDSSSPESSGEESSSSSEEEEGSSEEEVSEEEEGDTASGEGDISEEQALAVAENLLNQDDLHSLLFNYNSTSGFDGTSDINPSQMYWSVFKWYERQSNYREQTPDYDGYAQVSQEKMDELVERWYGPLEDLPALEPSPEALGDPVSGVLVNLDEDKGMYYFLAADMPITETVAQIKSAKPSGDSIIIKYDVNGEDGEYARTYVVKVKANEDGEYYVLSLNKGQE